MKIAKRALTRFGRQQVIVGMVALSALVTTALVVSWQWPEANSLVGALQSLVTGGAEDVPGSLTDPRGSPVGRGGQGLGALEVARGPLRSQRPDRSGAVYLAAMQAMRVLEQHYVEPSRLAPCSFLALAIERIQVVSPGLGLELSWLSTEQGARSAGQNAIRSKATGTRIGSGSSVPLRMTDLCPGTHEVAQRPAFVAHRLGAALHLDAVSSGATDPLEHSAKSNPRFDASDALASVLQWLHGLGADPEGRLFRAAFNEILKGLDPHSAFLSPQEYQELRGGTRGQFGGVGVVINDFQGLPFVREIVPNSPAQMAGIEPNDILLRIGDVAASFKGIEAALALIREKTLSGPLAAWFFRPRSRRVYKAFVSREEVPTASCEERTIIGAPDVLHVRVTGFSSRTSQEIYDIYLRALRREKGALKAMILDLRGNPGGLLDQAVQVSDLFLSEGKIVITKSRYESQTELASTSQLISLPLTVLVNASSASASEIVAAALKDAGRALVIGEQTFGKGSVQSLFEISQMGALKLTIAHYFAPSGVSIQNRGVTPHIVTSLAQIKEGSLWIAGSSERRRESGLLHHLEAPNGDGHVQRMLPQIAAGSHVWAFAKDELSALGPFGELSFGYPNFENTDKVVDPSSDSFVRVALSMIRASESAESGLWSLVRDSERYARDVVRREALQIASSLAGSGASGAWVQVDEQQARLQQALQAPAQDLEVAWNAVGLAAPRNHGPALASAPAFGVRFARMARVSRAAKRLDSKQHSPSLSARTLTPEAFYWVGLRAEEGRALPAFWIPVRIPASRLPKRGSAEVEADVVLPKIFWTAVSSVLGPKEEVLRFAVESRPSLLGKIQEIGVWELRSGDLLARVNSDARAALRVQVVEQAPPAGWRHFVAHASFGAVPGLKKPCEVVLAPLVDETVEHVAGSSPWDGAGQVQWGRAETRQRDATCPDWVGQFRVRQDGVGPGDSGFAGVVGLLLRDADGVVIAREPALSVEGGVVRSFAKFR